MRAPRRGPPRYLSAVLRWLFQDEIDATAGAEVCEELEHEYTIVRERHSGLVAWLWYLGQILRPSTWVLAREMRSHAFGGVERTKEEEGREAWGLMLLDHIWRDTRYAARRLGRDWRFTLPAVLVLALGIGANTAMFSAVNTALFRPLPFEDADRLVNIYQNSGETSQALGNSYPAYQDMAGYTDVFAGVAAFSVPMSARYQADAGIGQGLAEYATSNYLVVQGLDLAMGRWFSAEEDSPGAGAVAVLGHQTWTNKFGATPDVLGQTIRINGVPVTIIGVGSRRSM